MRPNSSSSINLAHLKLLKNGGRVADFRLPSHLTEGFVTENRAGISACIVFVPARKLSNKISKD